MSKLLNRETGIVGEQAASLYLQKKGYDVVESNYSTRFGEIDLICRENGVLVFVEVKTKISLAWGTPEEMFTRYKYQQVRRMGTIYLKGKEVPCRIDMVAVEMNEDKSVKEIRHYENVIF